MLSLSLPPCLPPNSLIKHKLRSRRRRSRRLWINPIWTGIKSNKLLIKTGTERIRYVTTTPPPSLGFCLVCVCVFYVFRWRSPSYWLSAALPQHTQDKAAADDDLSCRLLIAFPFSSCSPPTDDLITIHFNMQKIRIILTRGKDRPGLLLPRRSFTSSGASHPAFHMLFITIKLFVVSVFCCYRNINLSPFRYFLPPCAAVGCLSSALCCVHPI